MNIKSLAVFGLLLLPIALAPVAFAVDGLEAIILVTPKGRGVGQDVEINVETYFHGVLVDAEILDVIVDATQGPSIVTMTNVSTGKYRATYTIQNSDVHQDEMDITVSAQIGAVGTVSMFAYTTVATAASTGDWELTVRGVGSGNAGYWLGPGTNLTFEARSYLNGSLQDGGQINLTSTYTTGTVPTSAPLTITKVQDGVYQGNLSIPSDLSTSRVYGIEAKLGTGAGVPTESTTVMAHPFNAFARVTAQTDTSATVKVQAGDAAPLSGATVTLTGTAFTTTPPFVSTVGPFTGTTDANGSASVDATWTAGTDLNFWVLSVASGGKTTQLSLFLGVNLTQPPWEPDTPSPIGCDVVMQTDPSTLVKGQSAQFKFRVTQDGAAVVSGNITRIIWREGEGTTWVAGNATTDASGNFTVTLTVPANWTEDDAVHVSVVCPSWDAGEALLEGDVGATGPGQASKVTVSASGKLGGNVAVTATYSGTNALNGAQAFASIVPGNQSSITSIGLGGGGLSGALTKSGSTFTGNVAVPLWLGEGDYTVIVLITNVGATSTLSDQIVEGNMTTLHLTPEGSTGGNNPPPSGGFLPGFDASLAVAAAVAVGAVALVRRRR